MKLEKVGEQNTGHQVISHVIAEFELPSVWDSKDKVSKWGREAFANASILSHEVIVELPRARQYMEELPE